MFMIALMDQDTVTDSLKIRSLMCNARPNNYAWSRFFALLRRVLSELLNWKNNPLYSAFLILYSYRGFLYDIPVPDEGYRVNDETEESRNAASAWHPVS